MKYIRIITLLLVSLYLMSVSSVSEAAWLWSPETGKWFNMKDTPEDTPEEQFFVGKVHFDEGRDKRALDEFDKVIRHYPNSRWAAEAQYYKGLTYERLSDVGKAAESFQDLVDRYPYSERLNEAIEHEFELAEAMSEGKKTRFLGMEIIPAEEVAIQVYKHIVKSAPYGPYGAIAQYRLADAYLALGDFEDAKDAYQAVIDEYPNSEFAPKAKFKMAQVSHQSAMSERHHIERTDEALQKYEGFKRAYPDSYLQYEADDAIHGLREKKANGIYDIAIFYHKRKKYNSAKLYYKDIVTNYPQSEIADKAAAGLAEIESIMNNVQSKEQEDSNVKDKKKFWLF